MEQKNELRRTESYQLIKENNKIRLIDVRANDFRFLDESELITINNMDHDQFDDWALLKFEV